MRSSVTGRVNVTLPLGPRVHSSGGGVGLGLRDAEAGGAIPLSGWEVTTSPVGSTASMIQPMGQSKQPRAHPSSSLRRFWMAIQ